VIVRNFPAAIVFLVVVPFVLALPAAAERDRSEPARPRFTNTGDARIEEGHAVLSWTVAGEVDAADDLFFELHESRDPGFGNHQVLHSGPESVVFVSGLKQGTHYFRVRALQGGTAGPWSDAMTVEVDYPGRKQVLVLLVVGCLVFVATVIAILVGWMHHGKPERAADRAHA
jgi:hypothetical protein